MSEPDKSLQQAVAPLFTELGKAVYACQCFESSLRFLLSQMAHESAGGEEGAFIAAWDFHSKVPFGRLLRALRERIDVPSDLDDYLSVGIDKRNEIVHTSLTRNVHRIYDPKGRLELERELAELKAEVRRRDLVVNKLIDALLKKYGVSNESLKRDADRLWDHFNPSLDAPMQ